MSRIWNILSLALAALLALGLRALAYPDVFPEDGGVVLLQADSAYHARRALFSFVNFPALLRFDPYIAWPDGAVVPMPPLYDWALGGVARAFGDSEATFERVAAWWSPVLSALTVAPVYWIGRTVGGRGVGLAAAFFFALLPVGARRSMLGDVDHHAAVALLGAVWLAASVEIVRARSTALRLVVVTTLLAAVRAALVLSWSGSLLYVAVGEGGLLLATAFAGRTALCRAHAAGAVAASLGVAAWLVVAGPFADPLATTEVSWLHVAAFAASALVATAMAFAPRLGVTSVAGRLGLAAGLAVAVAGTSLWLLPDLRESLASAAAFLAKADSWGARNPEQRSLFSGTQGGISASLALRNYGWLAYVLPLALLCALERLRDARVRAAAVCVVCWSLSLAVLAATQVRFGSDFAPVVSVCLALLAGVCTRGLARFVSVRRIGRTSPSLRAAVVAAGFGLLLWPGIASTYVWPARLAHERARGAADTPRLSETRSIADFGRLVREATPETSGFLDPHRRPEYGVLSRPSQGHSVHYHARRATPANNMGPYLDPEKYELALRFYTTVSADIALRIAGDLAVRYVITFARDARGRPRFMDRLHRQVGASPERTQRFRLITEGPPGGAPSSISFASGRVPRDVIPYKLFELVPGAVLRARATQGTKMEVALTLVTPLGRRFVYRADSAADEDGRIALRVPYPTQAAAPVRSSGPYQVELGGTTLSVEVSEAEVREGASVQVGTASRHP